MNMETFKRVAIRALAVLGFVALLSVGMWGSVQLARSVPNAFSALAAAVVSLTQVFIPAGEEIVLATPSATQSANAPFTLSWTHEKKSLDGSYTFRYDCADGVSFSSPLPSGEMVTVFCNTPFNFLNSGNAIALTALSANNRFVDVTLYVDFTPNGQSRPTITGSKLITIENTGITGSQGTTGTTPTTPVPTTPITPTAPVTPTPGVKTETVEVIGGPTQSNPNGPTDLTARVIEIGVVDKTTGVFTASSTPKRTERVGVRFVVENIGTRRSGEWNFNVVLPTLPSHIFSSQMQQALGPGDRIEFTIGFDSFIDATQGDIVINIDPSNRLNENNKANNIIRYTVNVTK
jgi:hypothetical protein